MTSEAELSQVRLKVKLKTSSEDGVQVWTGAVLLLHVHYVQPVFYSCFKYAQRLVLVHIHHK